MQDFDEYLEAPIAALVKAISAHLKEKYDEQCDELADCYEQKMREQHQEMYGDALNVAQSTVAEIMGRLLFELPPETRPIVRATMDRIAAQSGIH